MVTVDSEWLISSRAFELRLGNIALTKENRQEYINKLDIGLSAIII